MRSLRRSKRWSWQRCCRCTDPEWESRASSLSLTLSRLSLVDSRQSLPTPALTLFTQALQGHILVLRCDPQTCLICYWTSLRKPDSAETRRIVGLHRATWVTPVRECQRAKSWWYCRSSRWVAERTSLYLQTSTTLSLEWFLLPQKS